MTPLHALGIGATLGLLLAVASYQLAGTAYRRLARRAAANALILETAEYLAWQTDEEAEL